MCSRGCSRSRSPRLPALSVEAREAVLAEFAQLYWAPPDAADVPPWCGDRALRIIQFRNDLANRAEDLSLDLDSDPSADVVCFRLPRREAALHNAAVRWQRFAFLEDVVRMSDVLFRGPIDARHADEVDARLHRAWRRFVPLTSHLGDLLDLAADFRVSAVRVGMMLETARPPEASQVDGAFELPDARTLASLLLLRCEKDDAEELLEMYRLLCQKLEGVTCAWCGKPFDERSSAGLWDGELLVIPTTVPKVLVPQCGHAIHTLCFGSQLRSGHCGDLRGACRRCGLDYQWTSIDVDPMVNVFCMMFGECVDREAREMLEAGEVSARAAVDIAEVCRAFSEELGGLISPSSAWVLLTKRHSFAEPGVVDAIGDVVLPLLTGPGPDSEGEELPGCGPDDRGEDDGDVEQDNVTEVFLPVGPPFVGPHACLPPLPDDDAGDSPI